MGCLWSAFGGPPKGSASPRAPLEILVETTPRRGTRPIFEGDSRRRRCRRRRVKGLNPSITPPKKAGPSITPSRQRQGLPSLAHNSPNGCVSISTRRRWIRHQGWRGGSAHPRAASCLRRGAHLSARTWRPEIPSARGSCHLVAQKTTGLLRVSHRQDLSRIRLRAKYLLETAVQARADPPAGNPGRPALPAGAA